MNKVTSILLLFLLYFPAYGQDYSKTEQRSDTINIYFDHNSYAINLDFQQNRESLLHLLDLIEKVNSDTLSVISKVEVDSYASPEGGRLYNKKLSERRTNSIYNYLINAIYMPSDLIDKKYSGSDWDMLQTLVEESFMQYRDEILYILKNAPEETWEKVKPNNEELTMVDSRNKRLMELGYGNPYRDMLTNIFPSLRKSSVVLFYSQKEVETKQEEAVEVVAAVEPEPKLESDSEPEPEIESIIIEPEIKPLFAFKTNLLYDAVTALNVEIEVPIGQRWSIAGEWVFPWWSSGDGQSSDRNCFQLLNGNIEAKYWFGDRTNRDVMTGWHLGLYAGGGLYDLEYNKEGYQGEFFIAAGLSAGYAHTINKSGSLRMEYSVAVGYLKTDYDRYAEHWGIDNLWHTIRQESGNYTWIGPTRAKVSLVWMLNRKVNKER